MKRNSLFLFLSMMFVWVGLCSAQTSSDKYVLIDGCFFNGMPPGIRTDEGAQMIMLTDEEGHTALEIRLNKGKTLPDYAMKYRVKVKDTTGRVWTKADIIGKPFVLNYWHTGCRPCIKEMPELNEWMKICPDVTYFSTTWNTAEQIKKIVENRPFLFTHIADELFFFNLFKVQVTPTTLLVDKKGIIRYWEEGTSESKRAYLLDRLKELSAE